MLERESENCGYKSVLFNISVECSLVVVIVLSCYLSNGFSELSLLLFIPLINTFSGFLLFPNYLYTLILEPMYTSFTMIKGIHT